MITAQTKQEIEALVKYREAQRDALYAEHGDNWRKFMPPGKFFSADCRNDAEEGVVMEARNG